MSSVHPTARLSPEGTHIMLGQHVAKLDHDNSLVQGRGRSTSAASATTPTQELPALQRPRAESDGRVLMEKLGIVPEAMPGKPGTAGSLGIRATGGERTKAYYDRLRQTELRRFLQEEQARAERERRIKEQDAKLAARREAEERQRQELQRKQVIERRKRDEARRRLAEERVKVEKLAARAELARRRQEKLDRQRVDAGPSLEQREAQRRQAEKEREEREAAAREAARAKEQRIAEQEERHQARQEAIARERQRRIHAMRLRDESAIERVRQQRAREEQQAKQRALAQAEALRCEQQHEERVRIRQAAIAYRIKSKEMRKLERDQATIDREERLLEQRRLRREELETEKARQRKNKVIQERKQQAAAMLERNREQQQRLEMMKVIDEHHQAQLMAKIQRKEARMQQLKEVTEQSREQYQAVRKQEVMFKASLEDARYQLAFANKMDPKAVVDMMAKNGHLEISSSPRSRANSHRRQSSRSAQHGVTDQRHGAITGRRANYATPRRRKCALCELEVDARVLETLVSFHRVLAVRERWGVETPHLPPSRRYDTVGVCAYCAQFFTDAPASTSPGAELPSADPAAAPTIPTH